MKTTNPHLIKLCALLNDLNTHDDNNMGKELNLSHAAIWKLITQLKNYGIPINMINGKGFRFRKPLYLLNAPSIKPLLPRNDLILTLLSSVDSTNAYLKKQSPTSKTHICLAEQQTAGRGRFARSWYSPFAENIYLSLCYQSNHTINKLSALGLAIGTIICDSLEQAAPLPEPLQLKWPNDIFFQGNKLGGILIETNTDMHGASQIIIGIGINVNMTHAHRLSFDQPWASLNTITRQAYNRNDLCSILIKRLITGIKEYEQHGFDYFIAHWQKRDYLKGQSIQLQQGNQTLHGTATGVNPMGHLIITLPDHTKRCFSSAAVNLHKKTAT